MNEPNLDRFAIRFADEWEPRPWPSNSVAEERENEKEREELDEE